MASFLCFGRDVRSSDLEQVLKGITLCPHWRRKTKSSDKVLQNHSKMLRWIHLGLCYTSCLRLTFPIKVIFCVSNGHRNHFGRLSSHSALPALRAPMWAWLWWLRWPATNWGIGWGCQAGCTKFQQRVQYVHTDGVQMVSSCKKQMKCVCYLVLFTYLY